MVTYWIRSAVGLERLAADEYAAKFGGAINRLSHRSAWVSSEQAIDITPYSLRLADDIYVYYGPVKNIDHTKASLQSLGEWVAKNLIDPIKKLAPKSIRTTVSFLGSRNYNRFSVEAVINQVILDNIGVAALSNEAGDSWQPNEVRIRVHLEDELAHVGIALFDKPLHRRDWRTESYEGQMHPPVAAAMASHLTKPVSCIVDPFCGSATLLIESLNYADPEITRKGFDLNPEAIEVAGRNVQKTGGNITLEQRDFNQLTLDMSDFGIITNPPWGKKYKQDGPERDKFYTKLTQFLKMAEWAIILMPESFRQWMLDDGIKFETLFVTRIRGQIVHALMLQ